MENQDVTFGKIRFMSFKEIQRITGMSRSTIYREVKKGKFPRPRPLSERKVGFVQAEVETWVEQRRVA